MSVSHADEVCGGWIGKHHRFVFAEAEKIGNLDELFRLVQHGSS